MTVHFSTCVVCAVSIQSCAPIELRVCDACRGGKEPPGLATVARDAADLLECIGRLLKPVASVVLLARIHRMERLLRRAADDNRSFSAPGRRTDAPPRMPVSAGVFEDAECVTLSDEAGKAGSGDRSALAPLAIFGPGGAFTQQIRACTRCRQPFAAASAAELLCRACEKSSHGTHIDVIA